MMTTGVQFCRGQNVSQGVIVSQHTELHSIEVIGKLIFDRPLETEEL